MPPSHRQRGANGACVVGGVGVGWRPWLGAAAASVDGMGTHAGSDWVSRPLVGAICSSWLVFRCSRLRLYVFSVPFPCSPHSASGSHAGGNGESRRCVQPDTEVACRVRDVEGSGGWTWILGSVLRYAADTKKYEVLDAGEADDDDDDDEDGGGGGGGGVAAGGKRRSGHAPQPKYVLCSEGDVKGMSGVENWVSVATVWCMALPGASSPAGGAVDGGMAVRRTPCILGAAGCACRLRDWLPQPLKCIGHWGPGQLLFGRRL